MRFAGATWRPISNNFSGPMGTIIGLCLHVQEGNGSLYGWFNNPNAEVSAHLWCGKDGTLEQYLDPPAQKAWAQANGNPNYISIETEGFVGEPLTDAQMLAVASILSQASTAYSFPVTGPVAHGQPGFTQHCNPNGTSDPSWGNHFCPGPIRLGQMPNIITMAHGSPAPPEPTPVPPQPPNPPMPTPIGETNVNVPVLSTSNPGLAYTPATKNLQTLLIEHGFGCGPTGADGKYGNATAAAVVACEHRYSLSVDAGIAGNQVWGALCNQ
jgi:hypothetical protein